MRIAGNAAYLLAMRPLPCHTLPMPLNIVLVHPEIPHNTGAIGRLCVGLDARLHLIRPLGFVLSDRWIRRAGLDYWEHLALAVHDSWDAFLLAVSPRRLHIASTRGRRAMYACTFEPDDCLVFGNESSGLPPDWYMRYRDDLFHIPMPGAHARSINLANAVAIVAYEAWRQTHTTRITDAL
jgi:tRNA (cytidine/uridine-2'-O-)-methyltransferase